MNNRFANALGWSTRIRKRHPSRRLRLEPLERRELMAAEVVVMDTTAGDEFRSNVRTAVESAIEEVVQASDHVWEPVALESTKFELEAEGVPLQVSNVVMGFDLAANLDHRVTTKISEPPKLYFTLVMHANNLVTFRAASIPPNEFLRRPTLLETRPPSQVTLPDNPVLAAPVEPTSRVADRVTSAEAEIVRLRASSAPLPEQERLQPDRSSPSLGDSVTETAPAAGTGDSALTPLRVARETNVEGMLRLDLANDPLKFLAVDEPDNRWTKQSHPDEPPSQLVGALDLRQSIPDRTGTADAFARSVPPGMLQLAYVTPTRPGGGENDSTQTAGIAPWWLLQTFVGTGDLAKEPSYPSLPIELEATNADHIAQPIARYDQLFGWLVITVAVTWTVVYRRPTPRQGDSKLLDADGTADGRPTGSRYRRHPRW